MDRLFYDELKRVIGEIATDEFDRAKARKVIGACELVMKYAIAAREYGLLKLEDEIVNLNKYSIGNMIHLLKYQIKLLKFIKESKTILTLIEFKHIILESIFFVV